MKRLFAALIIAVLSVTPVFATFTDVSSINSHYVAIEELVAQGILEGYEDGDFRPDQEVTRAEAVKIILLGMGLEVDEESIAGLLFSDVREEDWFFGYVSTAVSLGIINGYDDGTFLPDQTVNRAEVLKILTLTADAAVGDASEAPFWDVATDDWYAGYADFAKTWNIEPPQTDGLWHPADSVTRANISEMVYRMQIVDESGAAFDEATNWLTKEFPTVDISMKIPFGWNYKQDGVGAAWILDDANSQLSLLSPYDNGGTLLMTRNSNTEGLSASQLFAGIWDSGNQTTINGYSAYVTDDSWYLVMDNGSMVHFLAMQGSGAYSDYLHNYFELMIASVEYEPDGEVELSVDEIIEALRSGIQVDGSGAALMEYLEDWELIETDAIGVGTGPVDYFYSPIANITVKYERSFDVILDVEDGQTSAF